tara:strand:+ start:469 stop:1269 length:801 start_codon:yes stop_codon:yes gene_type:complete
MNTGKLKHYFNNSKFYSSKWENYFPVYEEIFAKYKNKNIKFVEIGIFSGGSLFMWKKFFGPKAKIIGIDLNPDSLELKKYGFEIEIGDQSNKDFWSLFFKKHGKIDIILDDGGHTNFQQIITANSCIPKINDGGLFVCEDTHASYLKRRFYNPSSYSFINFCKKKIDDIHSRTMNIILPNKISLSKYIYSINFYESIVCFQINRKLCKKNKMVVNNKCSSNPEDYRNFIANNTFFYKIKKLFYLKKINFTYLIFLINSIRLRNFFK